MSDPPSKPLIQPVPPVEDADTQRYVAAQLDLMFNLEPLHQMINIALVVVEDERRNLAAASTSMTPEEILGIWRHYHTLVGQMIRLVSERASAVIRAGRVLTETGWGG